MSLSPSGWHIRYTQQARWTQELRQYLYSRAGLTNSHRVLDVGCGTGVLLAELEDMSESSIYGLDIDKQYLSLANQSAPQASLVQGDGHQLPFAAQTFDIVLCHFVLLWVTDPIKVISHMARVTRSGGAVLALAEPDYGGRIDHPAELALLGKWQAEALERQGAEVEMGRQLARIFIQAGLESVEMGVLGGQWTGAPSREEWETEWTVLIDDLNQTSGGWQTPEARKKLHQLKALDAAAWQRGERVLFVPTFYAWGRVP
jgi:ubiquinone/menaquinone biosynthesis C-methylase UbiE